MTPILFNASKILLVPFEADAVDAVVFAIFETIVLQLVCEWFGAAAEHTFTGGNETRMKKVRIGEISQK